MKLQSVPRLFGVGDRRDDFAFRLRHGMEAGGGGVDMIAMAHPYLQGFFIDSPPERTVLLQPNFCRAVFASPVPFKPAAEVFHHRLHAVADAQYRLFRGDDARVDGGGVMIQYGLRSAGEDVAGGGEIFQCRVACRRRENFAVHLEFAHPPRDELGELRSKIENGYFFHAARPGDCLFDLIVRGFAGDFDIVHMRFADAGVGDADEIRLLETRQICRPDITHGGAQSPGQLV